MLIKTTIIGATLTLLMQYFRSLLFLFLYAVTGVIAGLVSILLFPLPFLMRYNIVMHWNALIIWLAKVIVGMNYRIIGDENIPKNTPYVMLCKHQSVWETLFSQVHFRPISTILKKELLFIPFFGWGLALLRPIAIDRGNPRQAIKQVHRTGLKRIEDGISVLVFPEGTRTPVGQAGNYARGGTSIACAAGVSILPVAHNAGELWPSKTLLKNRGTITVVIGQPIPTEGRHSKELTEEIKQWIENEIKNMPPARDNPDK